MIVTMVSVMCSVVSDCLQSREGKKRTPLSCRVATGISWSPLRGVKGVKPPMLQMGLRHRPLLLSCVHAQLCLTLCDPMDCSLPGSFCPWDAQIPQINVVGCGGVESLPTSAHTQGIQWVGVRCFTPSLALGRLFFLARGP